MAEADRQVFTRCLHTRSAGWGTNVEAMFAQELTNAGHIRRFEIRSKGPEGWEMRVEEDSTLLRRQRFTDWHRVERAITRAAMEIAELQNAGWTIRIATPATP